MLHLTNVTILDTLYPAHQIAPTSTIAGGQLASLNIFPEYLCLCKDELQWILVIT